MRAATYLRQSVDHAEGIERQRERTAALIRARGWELAAEYVDNDTSASKARGDDTGWAAMLASEADVVVAVDLDRLLRDVRDLSTLIDTGKKVVTVDGEIDLSTADGEFRATMLAGIARFEVRRKSERQRRANEARASRGEWVGGRRPFGFEDDGHTVRADEAQAIRDGFRDYLGGGNLSAIARDWASRGFTTGQGGEWERTAVRVVLTNPRYAGRVRHRGQVVQKDGRPVAAVWPALVDADTFDAVQALLGGTRGRVTSARSLLTGVATCGVAGCGATIHAGGNARRGVRGYRCSGSLGHFARTADPVDDYVDTIVARRLMRPDAAELVIAAEASPEAREKADALRVRRDVTLGLAAAEGTMTPAQIKVATDHIEAQLAELDAQLADAGRARVLGDLIGNGDGYLALPTARRRQVIDLLMEVRILPPGRGTRTFRPESVQIEWRRPGRLL
jgi:DNA invertase Pin-like site-specific DNA recombinase